MLLTVLSIIFSSALVGVLVSAPMGPAGVLCLRRTLYRGRKAGLLTGIGIMLSDVVYAIISFLGSGLLIDFLENNELIFRLIGSLMIMLLAIYLFRHPPTFDISDHDEEKELTPWQLIGSGFALTFASNPLIILVFLALFTRYGLVPEENMFLMYFSLTIIFIAIGGIMWWYALTTFVNIFRMHTSMTSIRMFNRVVAIIFMIVAILGIITTFFPITLNSKL